MTQPSLPTPNSGLRVFSACLLSALMIMMPFVQLAAASRRESGVRSRGPESPRREQTASKTAAAEDLFVNPLPAAGPITATKTDSYPSSPGAASPGDTITYAVDVTNTGATDATGVMFSDTIDANTTLVPGSLKVSPLAFGDTYSAIKNTPLVVAAPGVLANDTGLPAPTAVPIAGGATTQGGTVTLNTDGSFTYNPPNAAFTGADTFVYTATNTQAPPNAADAQGTVTINVDAAPDVSSTTPTNGALDQVTNTNITVTFTEPVNVTGNWFQIVCTSSGTRNVSDTVVTGGPTTFTINPNTDFTQAESCTVTVFAAQVADQDSNDPPDNMTADYAFTFAMDAAPSVTSTTPTNGATGVVTNSNVVVNFSESVNATTSSFTISCATSGAHAYALSASPGSTFTLNPTVDFAGGELCTVTVVAAQISDTDANDPPNNMLLDYVFSFTTDAPPSVTTTSPTNGATTVASNTNIVVNFSENVNATTSSFTIECPAVGNLQTYTVTGTGTNSITLDPTSNLPEGTVCTVTVIANQISDTDANDPPDNMATNFVFSFTTDTAPSVTATTPTNGATNQANNTNITVTFSEAVNVTGNWFQIVGATSGTRNVADTVVSGGPTTFTINPNSDFTNGESVTVTVFAAQVTDQDSGDPPDNMATNFVFSFTVDTPPTVTTTTPANTSLSNLKTTNVTINFSENVGVTAGGVTIDCGAGNIAFTGLPQTNVASIVLDPTSNLPAGSTCTVTVLSANTTDSDAGDPPNNLDGDGNGSEGGDYVFSFGVAPDAVNDAYNATGNVGIVIAANGVLANDVGPGAVVDRVGTASANTVVPATVATSGGGSVTMNADGSFTYVPLAGQASGTDTFKYRISNAGGVSTDATVTITITGIVWFICDACAGTNLGTLQNPYTSINSFSTNNTGAANKPSAGQRIYIRSGTYDAANDNLTLLANQIVTGQGQAATSFFTPEAPAPAAYAALTAGARPVIAPTAGNAVTLNSGNNLSHFNIGSNVSGTCAAGSSPTTGTLLTGASVGNLAIVNMIVNGCGRAINFTAGGTLAVTFDSVTSANSSTGGILIGSSAGAVNFNNVSVTSSAGTGVSLTSNTASFTFADLDISPDSGQRGFHATSNSGTITTTSGTIATTNQTAVEIVGTSSGSRTPLSMTLTSVSASASGGNPPNGIVLQNVNGPAASVGFVVVGDGANTSVGGNATGGTISSTSGADAAIAGNGVYLENADEVTLRRMTINGTNQNHGIRGVSVSNFTLEYSTVNGTNGTSTGLDEGSVNFDNLTVAAAITSCLIEGGLEENLNVVNTTGTLNRLTITGSTFGFNNTVNGNNNILIESQNAGTTLNFTLKSSTIKGARADWINISNNSSSVMDAVIGGPLLADGNTFDNLGANAHAGAAAGGNRVVTGSVGVATIDIRNNTMKGSKGEAIRVRSTATGALVGTVDARVRNNTIGVAATANSGSSEGSGIFVFVDGGASADVAITSNSIFQYNNHAIRMDVGDEINNGTVFNATVTGNTANTPGNINTDFNGIHLNHGTIGATDNFTSCVDIGGAGLQNNVAGSGTIAPNNTSIRVRQRQSTTVRLPGYGGANNDDAAVVSYLLARNTVATAAASNTVPTGGGFIGGAACTQPSFAMATPVENKQGMYLAKNDSQKTNSPSLFSNFTTQIDLSSLFVNLQATNDRFEQSVKLAEGAFASVKTENYVPKPEVSSQTSDIRSQRSEVKSNHAPPRADVRGQRPAIRAQRPEVRSHHANSAKVAKNQESGVKSHHAKLSRRMTTPVSGETVNHTVGTLPAGKAVRITFQVTVDTPFLGPNQVSNQGTVTHSLAGSPVVTDDPSTGTADDATVTPVLAAPDAVNDAYTAFKNTPLNVPAPGVLTNDTGTPTVSAVGSCADVTDPFTGCATTQGGTVTVNGDGSFNYTPPNATFTGADTFTYTATNGVGSDTATVTINVVDTSAMYINEVMFTPTGTDAPNEYIELRGAPSSTIPAGTYLVAIEGDSSDNPGDVQTIINLSGLTFGSNGFLVLLQMSNTYVPAAGATVVTSTTVGFGGLPGSRWSADAAATDIENASVTFLLIQSGVAPSLTDDLDAGNDGGLTGPVFDGWSVRDSIGVLDASGADFGYGAINFKDTANIGTSTGLLITVGFTGRYVGRICDSTGSTATDWLATGGLGGIAPNWTLGSSAETEPSSFAGNPLDHIGTTNFVNSAPVNTVPGAQNVNEDGTLTFNTGNSNLISIADSDAGANSVEVTLTATNGTMSLSGTAGLTFTTGDGTADTTMVFTGTVTDINTALNGMTFTPTSNYAGAASVQIQTNDQGNTGGAACSTSQSDSDTVNITVNAANDAPVLDNTGNMALTSIPQDVPAASNPGDLVSAIIASAGGDRITDVDAGAVEGIAVNAVNNTNGTWEFSTNNGGSWTAFGSPSDSVARLLASDANTRVRFQPGLGFSGTVNPGITFRAWDQTSGTNGTTANASVNGGTTAFSTATEIATITVSSTVSVQDATVAEPATSTTNMVFTVSLNAPAAAGGVSVNFTTADEPAGPGKAVAGTCGAGGDYVSTNGTINFAAGQQVKTISVPVCADGSAEPDETFLVNLSSPVNATIGDGTATGTITAANPAGTLLISEFRQFGPGPGNDPLDDFVEIYNNTNSPITVPAGGYGLFRVASTCSGETPQLIGTIPAGTVIPARGHFLFTGPVVNYSLKDYGGTNAATNNALLTADLGANENFGLFGTADVSQISSVNRFDAVGFGVNNQAACDLMREGATLAPLTVSPLLGDHSYFRKQCEWIQNQGCTVPGIPKDTNNNSVDFWLADTNGSAITGRLGAPGPENLASPIRRDTSGIGFAVLDGSVGSAAQPNRQRISTPVTNGSFGTMVLRYRVTNNTGAPVTRLRYRIVDVSTSPAPPGQADLRALTSSIEPAVGPVGDSVTCATNPPPPSNQTPPCTVAVTATTLETPPNQPNGGGYNSTLSSGTITTGTPLAPGASILINFRLGVQQTGTFRFYIIIEALP